MKLIVGLGNPGNEYADTRHNIGFMAVDFWAKQQGLDFKVWGNPKSSDLIKIGSGDDAVLLLKPLTYMNLSGQSVVAVAMFHKILPEDICVLHDELDLPFGDVRLKVGGGDGGHNGLKSLTKYLATNQYARIRMGIGRPLHPSQDVADFVLGRFEHENWPEVESMIGCAVTGIEAFIKGSNAFLSAMNQMNRSKDPKKNKEE